VSLSFISNATRRREIRVLYDVEVRLVAVFMIGGRPKGASEGVPTGAQIKSRPVIGLMLDASVALDASGALLMSLSPSRRGGGVMVPAFWTGVVVNVCSCFCALCWV